MRIILSIVLVMVFLIPSYGGGSEKPRKCIMVVGAHADDVEGMAGGTFAKYIADGYQGIYVCITNNTAGNQIEKVPGKWDFGKDRLVPDPKSSPKRYPVEGLETMQIRQDEARQAAEVFGAVPVFLNFCEPEIFLGRKLVIYGSREFLDYDPPGRKIVSLGTRYSEDINLVVELLKKYQPEITIIHTPGGEKTDHEDSGLLVYLAFKKAIANGINVGQLWTRPRGWLADAEAIKSGRGKPDVKIDVREYRAKHYGAWNKHVSQNGGDIEKELMGRASPFDRDSEQFIVVLDNTK
jgi:LmbE family N-acetylglucosaminyl deacetylase